MAFLLASQMAGDGIMVERPPLGSGRFSPSLQNESYINIATQTLLSNKFHGNMQYKIFTFASLLVLI